MTSRDFVYWLQGFAELNPGHINREVGLTSDQWETVKKHLALVFIHEIDPSMGDKKHQDNLNKIHGGGSSSSGPTVYRC